MALTEGVIMGDFIGIDLQGIQNILSVLQRLPKAARDEFSEDTADFLIKELCKEPPSRYVTRKAAYGKTFFSDKQRRWFFWALGTGKIGVPYRRTGALSRGWQKIGSGENLIIANEREGAQWVMGDTQSRHGKMVGWKTYVQVIEKNIKTIETRGAQMIGRVLRNLGWR